MISRIFIADDNEDYVLLFRQCLNRINPGHQVMSAANGYQALSYLRFMLPSVPDFIFVDLRMPIMNGHEIIQELRKIPELSHVPVIVFSAIDYPEDRRKAEEAGIENYFIKPAHTDELNNLLLKILNLKNISE